MIFHSYSCEELELTANSLGAHIETHVGLILRTLSSQWTHKMTHIGSFPWACCELLVRSPRWAHHAVVGVSSLLSCKLTENSQQAYRVSSSCELNECPKNEPPTRWFRWALCVYGVSSHFHWDKSHHQSTHSGHENCRPSFFHHWIP